ncbi:MAG TPA: metallophosphoesterase [Leptolinea sp.]
MPIAITADLHLTSRTENPQRFAALEEILDQMILAGSNILIIAGDLFDQNRRDFHEFEEIIKRREYTPLHFVILPGNHDASLSQSYFSLPNVLVIDQPRLVRLEEKGLPFFFLPYKARATAGSQLSLFRNELPQKEYVLISHGNYISGPYAPNPLERGVYLPLSRTDLDAFQPGRVFLGHTHLPFQLDRVISPGSPVAIDPTETGRRGFWLFDSVANILEHRIINQGPIFMREEFLIIPSLAEQQTLEVEIHRRVQSWGFSPEELKRVQLLAVFSGCAADRSALRKLILEALGQVALFPDGEPDLSGVLSEADPALAAAAAAAFQNAAGLTLSDSAAVPEPAEINRAIIRLVYGV